MLIRFQRVQTSGSKESVGHLILSFPSDRVFGFVDEMPGPLEYTVCARLAKNKLAEYENEWKNSPISKESSLEAKDFDLARTRIDALFHAAGPDFDMFFDKNKR